MSNSTTESPLKLNNRVTSQDILVVSLPANSYALYAQVSCLWIVIIVLMRTGQLLMPDSQILLLYNVINLIQFRSKVVHYKIIMLHVCPNALCYWTQNCAQYVQKSSDHFWTSSASLENRRNIFGNPGTLKRKISVI